MGSAIDSAVATSILNTYLRSRPRLLPRPRALFFATEHTKCQHVERREAGIGKEGVWRGYNLQFRIVTGVAGAQFFATGIVWGRMNAVV
jgi:hypothetical protein